MKEERQFIGRPLTVLEALGVHAHAGISMVIHGPKINESMFRPVLQKIGEHHPFLRSKLEVENNVPRFTDVYGPYHSSSEDFFEIKTIKRESKDHAQRYIETYKLPDNLAKTIPITLVIFEDDEPLTTEILNIQWHIYFDWTAAYLLWNQYLTLLSGGTLEDITPPYPYLSIEEQVKYVKKANVDLPTGSEHLQMQLVPICCEPCEMLPETSCFSVFRTIQDPDATALLNKCKEEKVSFTSAIAVALTAANKWFLDSHKEEGKSSFLFSHGASFWADIGNNHPKGSEIAKTYGNYYGIFAAELVTNGTEEFWDLCRKHYSVYRHSLKSQYYLFLELTSTKNETDFNSLIVWQERLEQGEVPFLKHENTTEQDATFNLLCLRGPDWIADDFGPYRIHRIRQYSFAVWPEVNVLVTPWKESIDIHACGCSPAHTKEQVEDIITDAIKVLKSSL
jgi:hypothetical protein